MLYREIPLREDDPSVTLTAYIADERRPTRDAMLVIPGGGYTCVCADREGEPIALAFLAAGLNAFVLQYSIGAKAVFPRPLVDASLAMQHIRTHAEEYHIHPDRVFVSGFSAGGHLAASLGTFWHLDSVKEALPDMPEGMNRPTGTVLCYPVLTGGPKAHKGSFYQILGTKTPTEEELDRYSIEKHIDERTSPAFIMHTAADQIVPVENALYTAQAMAAAKVPFELHIYPEGPHGIALGNFQTSRGNPHWEDAEVEKWVSHAVAWMKKI